MSGTSCGGYEWRHNASGFYINDKAMRAEHAFTLPDGGRVIGSPNPRYVINPKWLQSPVQFLPKGHLEEGLATSNGASLATVFSDGSSPDRLTEEQEDEIAENIFDWWISGKPYKKWYADKFLQQKLNFEEE